VTDDPAATSTALARLYDLDLLDDPAMLDRARAAAATAGAASRIELVASDIEGLRLPRAGDYRLAFIGLNSLFLLDGRAAQAAAVATLATHLAPGGLAVVDAWLPDAEDLARFDGRLVLEWVRRDPETNHLVTKAGSALHDAATTTVRLTSIFDEGDPGAAPIRWIREERLRLTSADELRAFAEATGLEVETVAGGYDLEPLAPGSERAILVARRVEAASTSGNV
jgi:hypothetical protein